MKKKLIGGSPCVGWRPMSVGAFNRIDYIIAGSSL
jgi:hypothetical protein